MRFNIFRLGNTRYAVALLILGAVRLLSQTVGSAQVVRARVIGVYDEDAGTPIQDAVVTNLLTGDHASTTETGTVALPMAIGSRALVEVKKLGYAPWRAIVDPSDTVPITVVLERVVMLSPVRTTANTSIAEDAGLRDGFDRRCGAPHVTCIKESDLINPGGRTIGDFIQRADGISHGLSMHGTLGGDCSPTYYVDGFRWDTKKLGPPIDRPGATLQAPFVPSNVEKVEVYAPSTSRPLRFEGDPSCGVVVIWTR